jgi:hypothetical protein
VGNFRVTVFLFARALLVLFVIGGAGGLLRSDAHAASEEQTLRRMVDLNKRALAAHTSGRHANAKKLLQEALSAAKAGKLDNHLMAARTYIHLGIVSIAGLNQREEGLAAFTQAVKLKPDIKLTPKLSTPALESDLQQARLMVVASTPPTPVPLAQPAAPSSAKRKETASARIDKVSDTASDNVPLPYASDDEPDVPASVPQPLYCPVPIEGPPAQEVNLLCLTQPEIRVSKVVAYYRPAAGETYTAVPMSRSRKGWYSAVIPATQVSGRTLQFYFEAQGDGNDVAVQNGRSDSPNVIVLKEGAPPVGVGALAALHAATVGADGRGNETSPIELREREVRESEERSRLRRRAPGSLWLGIGVGTGRAWHGKLPLERHPARSVTAGVSPLGLGHLVPELGLQVGERLSLSVQSRHQYIPPSGSGDAEALGSPPKSAHAVMIRMQYALLDLADLQLMGSAGFGAGSAVRMKVEPARQLGLVTSDTVVTGPLLAGLGLGLAYNFSDHWLALAEARVLGTGWKVGLMGEINAGVQIAF